MIFRLTSCQRSPKNLFYHSHIFFLTPLRTSVHISWQESHPVSLRKLCTLLVQNITSRGNHLWHFPAPQWRIPSPQRIDPYYPRKISPTRAAILSTLRWKMFQIPGLCPPWLSGFLAGVYVTLTPTLPLSKHAQLLRNETLKHRQATGPGFLTLEVRLGKGVAVRGLVSCELSSTIYHGVRCWEWPLDLDGLGGVIET